jgi:hypothetical protein
MRHQCRPCRRLNHRTHWAKATTLIAAILNIFTGILVIETHGVTPKTALREFDASMPNLQGWFCIIYTMR